MKTIIEAAINKAQRDIAKTERGIETLRNLPQMEGIESAHASAIYSGSAFVTAVYDLPTYRRNRQLLRDAGWVARKAFVVSDRGWRYTELERGDEHLTYIMATDAPGSTCTREQVGEVAQAVYRVTCAATSTPL